MGGSHGLQHPGIVHQALSAERNEVYNSCNASEAIGISCNPMCESALSNVMGVEFVGIVGIVDEVLGSRD